MFFTLFFHVLRVVFVLMVFPALTDFCFKPVLFSGIPPLLLSVLELYSFNSCVL